MDAEDRRLLLEIHGTVSGIQPVLEANTATLRVMDERQRKGEMVSVEHGVKIERLESDVDGLGRKLRSQSLHLHQGGGGHGRWLSFLEAMVILPKYWHILLGLGGVASALISILLRLHGVHK